MKCAKQIYSGGTLKRDGLTDDQSNGQKHIDSGHALTGSGHSLTGDVRQDGHDDPEVDVLHDQYPHQYDVIACVGTT